ncbi:MAG: hypothetical protein ACR2QB_04055 [Gammaproteobacteria bacterium]
MFRRLPVLLVLLSCFVTAPAVLAETLLVEGLAQGSASAPQRPNRGMSMDKVSATWGQPAAKNSAVGDPPIARWEYSDFVVYFEYSKVIHSVQKR